MAEDSTMKCSVFLGRPVTLVKESGKVIANKQTSATHIEGNVVSTNYGGNTHSDISSTVIHKSKIWYVDSDGKESFITLNNTNIGEREGHALSIARIKGKSAVAGYNHTMDMFEWWGASFRDACLTPPKSIVYAVIFLPIILLWGKYLFTYTTMSIMEVSLYSIGIFAVWGVVAGLITFLLVMLRGAIFKARYKSAIESFLKEPVPM